MASTLHQSVERGDVVTVGGRRVGEPSRMGEVLEILGPPDLPHYAVRWEDGHESILYPGETTTFSRKPAQRSRAPRPDVAATTAQLIETLREAGVEFELLPHRRTTTAAAEARVLGVLPQAVAKTVIATFDEGACVRAVVPASAHVSLTKLGDALSSATVEVLTEADLVRAYPQFELGAVPPFGGPAGDRVIVDRRVGDHDHVVIEGGVHDTSLRMRTEDLISVADAEVADIAID